MSHRVSFNWDTCRTARETSNCRPLDSGLFPCMAACKSEVGISLIKFNPLVGPYTCYQCPEDYPPCAFHKRIMNVTLQELIRSEKLPGEFAPMCPIDCISKGVQITIATRECAGCLLCAASCPIDAVVVDDRMRAHICNTTSCSLSCLDMCPVNAITLVHNSDQDGFDTLTCKSETRSVQSRTGTRYDEWPTEAVVFPKALVHALSDKYKLIHWTGAALGAIVGHSNEVGYEITVPGDYRPIRLEVVIVNHQHRVVYMLSTKTSVLDLKSIDRHLSGRDSALVESSSLDYDCMDAVVVNCDSQSILNEAIPSKTGRKASYKLKLVSVETIHSTLFARTAHLSNGDLGELFAEQD